MSVGRVRPVSRRSSLSPPGCDVTSRLTISSVMRIRSSPACVGSSPPPRGHSPNRPSPQLAIGCARASLTSRRRCSSTEEGGRSLSPLRVDSLDAPSSPSSARRRWRGSRQRRWIVDPLRAIAPAVGILAVGLQPYSVAEIESAIDAAGAGSPVLGSRAVSPCCSPAVRPERGCVALWLGLPARSPPRSSASFGHRRWRRTPQRWCPVHDELEAGLRRVVADEIGDYLARAIGRRSACSRRAGSATDGPGDPAPGAGQPRRRPRCGSANHRCRPTTRTWCWSVCWRPRSPRRPASTVCCARDDVTDVFVNGCDDVRLVTIDGGTEFAEPIARTDAELIEMIQTLARRGGHMEREFTPIAAAAGSAAAGRVAVGRRGVGHEAAVPDGPSPPARRRRPEGSRGSRNVRRRTGIAVRGAGTRTPQRVDRRRAGRRQDDVAAGACCTSASPTSGSSCSSRNPSCTSNRNAGSSRPRAGVHGAVANTEGVGAVSLADLGRAIKRFTPRRIVVGEVRGPEVIDMLEAMTQGIAGSMCTIHADSSWSVFPRLPVYARAGGRDWSTGDVLQLAALGVGRDRVPRPRSKRAASGEPRSATFSDSTPIRVRSSPTSGSTRAETARRSAIPTAPIPVALLDELIDHGYDPTLHESCPVTALAAFVGMPRPSAVSGFAVTSWRTAPASRAGESLAACPQRRLAASRRDAGGS